MYLSSLLIHYCISEYFQFLLTFWRMWVKTGIIPKFLKRAFTRPQKWWNCGRYNKKTYPGDGLSNFKVLRVHHDILIALDIKGQEAILLLLDHSAAFDTINLDMLSQRFSQNYGIESFGLKWLKSYHWEPEAKCNPKRSQTRWIPSNVQGGGGGYHRD